MYPIGPAFNLLVYNPPDVPSGAVIPTYPVTPTGPVTCNAPESLTFAPVDPSPVAKYICTGRGLISVTLFDILSLPQVNLLRGTCVSELTPVVLKSDATS